jgi:hypothetical protein
MPLEVEGAVNEDGYFAGWKLEEYLRMWAKKWGVFGKVRSGVKVWITSCAWALFVGFYAERDVSDVAFMLAGVKRFQRCGDERMGA